MKNGPCFWDLVLDSCVVSLVGLVFCVSCPTLACFPCLPEQRRVLRMSAIPLSNMKRRKVNGNVEETKHKQHELAKGAAERCLKEQKWLQRKC